MSSATKPVEQKARELLASKWQDSQWADVRAQILDGSCTFHSDPVSLANSLAIEAIIATLTDGERIRREALAQEAVSQWGGYASIGDFIAVLAEVRSSCERAGLMECAEEVRRARSVINALSTPSKGVG